MRALGMLVVLLLATQASADDAAKRAEAIALFDQARVLMQEGNYAQACPKLAEAQRLTPGLGILFNLADCYEHLGKVASAWAAFREVASVAATSGQPEREKDARARAQTLEPRVSRLLIEVSAPVDGLTVTRNGEPLSRAQWGAALPVDADRYRIKAEAPGKTPWEEEVVVEREGTTAKVVVPKLADAGARPRPRAVAPGPRREPLPPPEEDRAPRTWQKPLGIALFTVGLATLVAGGVVAGVAKATADAADCDADDLCSQDGVTDRDQAQLMGNVATGLIVGGAVVGAAGLVVWLTAPSSGEAARRKEAPSTEATRKESPTLALGLGTAQLRIAW